MPLYEVNHCVPLAKRQKDALAEFITDLHATTFVTPRLFVNIKFAHTTPVGEIYAGGKPRGQTVPNHIRATVRVGPTRPKQMYDEVALKIQKHWSEIISDEALGAQVPEGLTVQQKTQLQHLHAIVFCPMIAAMENGVIVPEAGGEGAWLEENMPFFKEQADLHGNEDVKEMLAELRQRTDLQKLMTKST